MARTRRTLRTPENARKAWLLAFEAHGTVTDACKVTGVGRSTVYGWRQQHEEFAVAWADVEEATTERMEREAFRRGTEGFIKDVYHRGEVVGQERQYSDTLLIFMLKSRRPERYRDNVKIEHGGSVSHGVRLSGLTQEQLDQLEALLAHADPDA